jgi:hypothetical protein
LLPIRAQTTPKKPLGTTRSLVYLPTTYAGLGKLRIGDLDTWQNQ